MWRLVLRGVTIVVGRIAGAWSLCRLALNVLGPEGAAAISSGLASVPQLLTLEYVCVCGGCPCVRVSVFCGARDLVPSR